MKRTFLAATCLLGAALPSQASAGPYADTLGRCAIQATSTEDRAALTRWIFIAASSNPALADLVTIPAAAREQSSRAVARLVNRILLEGCRRETVAAVQHEGQGAIQGAFQALGQMAGIEMMAAPEAQAALRGLDGYLDAEGLEALGREAMIRPGA
jgi:hypothetical protein